MSNLNDPVLPGKAASDYERYLRTDELLALQKPPAEMLHRDELLFQTIHQSAELWLKLACYEVETAIARLDHDERDEQACRKRHQRSNQHVPSEGYRRREADIQHQNESGDHPVHGGDLTHAARQQAK